MVSSATVTSSQYDFGSTQEAYFKRIADMNLKNLQIIGFRISNKETFNQATEFAKGAINRECFYQKPDGKWRFEYYKILKKN